MTRKIPYWAFIDAAARAFEVRTDQVIGPRRFRNIVMARAVAASLLRKHRADLSLMEIGRRLGGKDHTSIKHGIEKIVEPMLIGDDWFAERYAAAEKDALSWTPSTPRAAGSDGARSLSGRDLKNLSAVKFGPPTAKGRTDHFWKDGGEPPEFRAMREDARRLQRAFIASVKAERVA